MAKKAAAKTTTARTAAKKRKAVKRAQVTRPEPREADFSDTDWSTARKTVRQPQADHIVRFTVEDDDGEKVLREELIDDLPDEALEALGIQL